ncbi:MAG: hypothetical protein E7077_05230 [Bacteroidales bacterium]|jgi:FKBP-type peptidyl-prolyl cis-trans isomerase|nr:hypothetical protein [Bacteroidales bacterium]
MNIRLLLAIATPLFAATIFSSCDDDDDDTSKLNSYQENKEYGEKFLMEKRTEEGILESSTGLLFKVNTFNSKGIRPEDGDTIYAVVTGNKIENKQNEFRYDTIKGPMQGQVKALTEGIKYMTVGSDFDFYSPYYLAYGTVTYEGMSRDPKMTVTVNPYSAVKFNVKLLGVKKLDK